MLADVASRPATSILEFRARVREIAVDYDFVLIDCLPSFGNLLSAAYLTADFLIVPTHLERLSIDGIPILLENMRYARRHGNRDLQLLGIFANQVIRPLTTLESVNAEDLVEKFGADLMFRTRVARSVRVGESHALGESLQVYRSGSNQARQFRELTDEILERIGVSQPTQESAGTWAVTRWPIASAHDASATAKGRAAFSEA